MFQYREYLEWAKDRSVRRWTSFGKRLVTAVVPFLSLLRKTPVLGHAMDQTTVGLRGKVFRNSNRGDHRAAFAAAMEGVKRYQVKREGFLARKGLGSEFFLWSFLEDAVLEAEYVGVEAQDEVAPLVENARAPSGMHAASCLWRISLWRWRAQKQEEAVRLARLAVVADPSWPYGHVLLGWYGLMTRAFDGLPHLREALRVEPSCSGYILNIAEFVKEPRLLGALGLRLAGQD